MEIPILGARQFYLLTLLLPGRALTPRELNAAAGNLVNTSATRAALTVLQEHGLLDVLEADFGPDVGWILVYRINDAGRRWWRETADWYLHVIDGAAKADTGDPGPDDVREIRAARPSDRQRDRRPTPAEDRRIAGAGSAAFARMYRAVRLTGLSHALLSRLDVGDVDLERNVIDVPANRFGVREIVITAPLREVIGETIGNRTAGPLFLNDAGERWTGSGFRSSFQRRRRRAGVSPDAKLYGRHNLAQHLSPLAEASDNERLFSINVPGDIAGPVG